MTTDKFHIGTTITNNIFSICSHHIRTTETYILELHKNDLENKVKVMLYNYVIYFSIKTENPSINPCYKSDNKVISHPYDDYRGLSWSHIEMSMTIHSQCHICYVLVHENSESHDNSFCCTKKSFSIYSISLLSMSLLMQHTNDIEKYINVT